MHEQRRAGVPVWEGARLNDLTGSAARREGAAATCGLCNALQCTQFWFFLLPCMPVYSRRAAACAPAQRCTPLAHARKTLDCRFMQCYFQYCFLGCSGGPPPRHELRVVFACRFGEAGTQPPPANEWHLGCLRLSLQEPVGWRARQGEADLQCLESAWMVGSTRSRTGGLECSIPSLIPAFFCAAPPSGWQGLARCSDQPYFFQRTLPGPLSGLDGGWAAQR